VTQSPALVVLMRAGPGAPPPPELLPLGRAALALESRGVPVVVADTVVGRVAEGHRARPGLWAPARFPVLAAHDRFAGHASPRAWAAALEGLGFCPVGNPPTVTRLLRDKLLCQRALEDAAVPMPEVEADPAKFDAALERWGTAFLKPRFGSLGRGVRAVKRNDPLPAHLPGTAEQPDPAILQRAIAPAHGAGLVLRLLLQADGDDLVLRTPVARSSEDDPVVNVDRGARARPAEQLVGSDTLAEAERLARQAHAALDAGPLLLELGIDLAVDPDGRPWIIELNGCPRGRLKALAAQEPERFATEHAAACELPLMQLARRCGLL